MSGMHATRLLCKVPQTSSPQPDLGSYAVTHLLLGSAEVLVVSIAFSHQEFNKLCMGLGRT
jgi:hypothetical protein